MLFCLILTLLLLMAQEKDNPRLQEQFMEFLSNFDPTAMKEDEDLHNARLSAYASMYLCLKPLNSDGCMENNYHSLLERYEHVSSISIQDQTKLAFCVLFVMVLEATVNGDLRVIPHSLLHHSFQKAFFILDLQYLTFECTLTMLQPAVKLSNVMHVFIVFQECIHSLHSKKISFCLIPTAKNASCAQAVVMACNSALLDLVTKEDCKIKSQVAIVFDRWSLAYQRWLSSSKRPQEAEAMSSIAISCFVSSLLCRLKQPLEEKNYKVAVAWRAMEVPQEHVR